MSNAFDDERISAYLDGELDASAREHFEAEMAASPSLHQAVSELGHLRVQVRSLGPEEPPFGLFERMVRPQRARRRYLLRGAGVAAVAAAVLLVIGVFSGTGGAGIVPALSDYVDQHASALESGEPIAGFALMDRGSAMRSAPDMSPMQLTAAYHGAGADQYIYDGGAMGMVSIFVQRGRCDFDKLPAGETMTLSGTAAWHSPSLGGQSVVVRVAQRGGKDMIYTVVGSSTADSQVLETASHL